jgi:alkyl sulfatase BDS1-like metallo-beta-lactamase superfamily hydrolase
MEIAPRFVGIDVAKVRLDVTVRPSGEAWTVANDADGIDGVVARLRALAPIDVIARTGTTMTIDGVNVEFQVTPDTEASAAMNFYLAQVRALCAAENAVPLVHNVCTLRGAQVRDARRGPTTSTRRSRATARNRTSCSASTSGPAQQARSLLAHAYEQLGYQVESGPWRNFYLTGAAELRRGVPSMIPAPSLIGPDVATAMTAEALFDDIGVRLNGPDAGDTSYAFAIDVTGSQEKYLLRLRNGAISYEPRTRQSEVNASVQTTHEGLVALALGTAPLPDLISGGTVQVSGDTATFDRFLGLLDTFAFWFDVVTP